MVPDRVCEICSLKVKRFVHELNWRGNICRAERKLERNIDRSVRVISRISTFMIGFLGMFFSHLIVREIICSCLPHIIPRKY